MKQGSTDSSNENPGAKKVGVCYITSAVLIFYFADSYQIITTGRYERNLAGPIEVVYLVITILPLYSDGTVDLYAVVV